MTKKPTKFEYYEGLNIGSDEPLHGFRVTTPGVEAITLTYRGVMCAEDLAIVLSTLADQIRQKSRAVS